MPTLSATLGPTTEATPEPPGEATVLAGDLREGKGGMRVRVHVLSIEGGNAECVLTRSGIKKTLRVATLARSYRLIERDHAKVA